MKLNLILGLFVLALTTTVHAAPYSKAGCGWGSQVMGKDGNQVLAATTNGTSGNQTFGITSGTSNCTDSASSAALYIQNNQLALSSDIAKGSGETLVGLSQTYGCSEVESLGVVLQQNYLNIFSSENATAQDIEKQIRNVIRNDSNLSCSTVG